MQVGAKPPSTTPPLPQRKRRGWLAGTGGDWAEGAPLSDPRPGAPGAQSAPLTSGLLPGGPRACPSPPPPPHPACGTHVSRCHMPRGQTARGAALYALGFPWGQVFLPQGTALLPAPRTPAGGRAITGWGPGVGGGQSRAVCPPLWLRGLGERAPQPESGGCSVDPALGCGCCSQHP